MYSLFPMYFQYGTRFIGLAIVVGLVLWAVISAILFVREGKAAKSEGRKRNGKITASFIISLIVAGLVVLVEVLLVTLTLIIMYGM